MSESDLKKQVEELKEINKDLEKQLHQLIKEKDTSSNDDLTTDYQRTIENN